MRTSEERVAELHRRMDERLLGEARRRYRMYSAAAGAVCLAAVILLAVSVENLPRRSPVPFTFGMAGSVFANHDSALGYIVVALASMCLGVLFTIFCLRLKRRMKEDLSRDDRKD